MIEKANALRRIVAYLGSVPLSRDLRQARLASLRQLQSPEGDSYLIRCEGGIALADALWSPAGIIRDTLASDYLLPLVT